jgi:hypothetical protein
MKLVALALVLLAIVGGLVGWRATAKTHHAPYTYQPGESPASVGSDCNLGIYATNCKR